MLLTPAVIGAAVLYVYPLLYELNVSFTKMSIRYFVTDPGFLGLNSSKGNIFVGFQNYIDVFTSRCCRGPASISSSRRPSSGRPSTSSST